MYKIMIHIDTHTNDTWFYYQEEGKDYVANSLEEIRETVLTLIDVYGEDYIKIVKQETGDDMSGSVETFLYDSTDNYEELVNRPFINGVEIVGALSLAELGIQPVGDYATNERVDALEETVNNIDFSPYATNERVDQVEARVDAIDLEPYATMDYLDEVVAGIDFSASNENITGVKTFSVLPRSTVTPVTEDELTNKAYVDHEVFGCATEEYVDEAIANTKIPVFTLPSLGAVAQYTYMAEDEAARFLNYCSEHYGEYIHVYVKCGTTAVSGIYSGQLPTEHIPGSNIAIFKLYSNVSFYRSGVVLGATLNTYITITENGYVQADGYNRPGIELSGTGLSTTQFLSKTNTNYYSPTGDYNPATKKYVDDSIANIEIPEVNLDEYATTEYVDDAIANIDIPESGSVECVYNLVNKTISEPFKAVNLGLGESSVPGFRNALRQSVDAGYKNFMINIYFSKTGERLELRCIIDGETISISCWKAWYVYSGNYLAMWDPINVGGISNISEIDTADYFIRYQFKNRAVSALDSSQILPKNNTTEYIPTGDYHPATKKYVDDAISNIDIPESNTGDYVLINGIPHYTYVNSSLRYSSYDMFQPLINSEEFFLKVVNDLHKLNVGIANIKVFSGEISGNARQLSLPIDVVIRADLDTTATLESPVWVTTEASFLDRCDFDTNKYIWFKKSDVQNSVYFNTESSTFVLSSSYNYYMNDVCGNSKMATTAYVDDAVANIDVPDVDLTDYYNKTEVDNKISEMLSSAITNTLEGEY